MTTKGLIEMHVAIDGEKMSTVPFQFRMSIPTTTGNSERFSIPIANKVRIVCGNGAYDTGGNFNFLHNRGIEDLIPPR